MLFVAAFVFSWRYFSVDRAAVPRADARVPGRVVGFCLTGDLFNLFVFFELLSVAAYALTAYDIEEEGPLGSTELRDLRTASARS